MEDTVDEDGEFDPAALWNKLQSEFSTTRFEDIRNLAHAFRTFRFLAGESLISGLDRFASILGSYEAACKAAPGSYNVPTDLEKADILVSALQTVAPEVIAAINALVVSKRGVPATYEEVARYVRAYTGVTVTSNTMQQAAAVHQQQRPPRICHACGQPGHIKYKCPQYKAQQQPAASNKTAESKQLQVPAPVVTGENKSAKPPDNQGGEVKKKKRGKKKKGSGNETNAAAAVEKEGDGDDDDEDLANVFCGNASFFAIDGDTCNLADIFCEPSSSGTEISLGDPELVAKDTTNIFCDYTQPSSSDTDMSHGLAAEDICTVGAPTFLREHDVCARNIGATVPIILDTGTPVSIFRDSGLFDTLRKMEPAPRLKSAGGHALRVVGKGSALGLNRVFYSPGITLNLIADHDLHDAGYRQLHTDSVNEKRFRHVDNPEMEWCFVSVNRQWILSSFPSLGIVSAIRDTVDLVGKGDLSDKEMTRLYHARLGHPAERAVIIASQPGYGVNFPPAAAGKLGGCCESCVAARMKRKSFKGKSDNKTWDPGERFHRDKVGPIAVVGIYKERYVEIFVDTTSQFVAVYPCRDKSAATSIQHVQDLVRTELAPFNRVLKVLRSDQAAEYTGEEAVHHARANRILLEYGSPRHPELNGKVERAVRTLTETVRALLYHSGAPKFLWPFTYKHAALLRNMLPSVGGNGAAKARAPMTVLQGRLPNFKRLRVWGSHCYYYLEPHLRDKLDAKAASGIYVGNSTTGWLVYDKARRTVVDTAHVVFEERLSPPVAMSNNIRSPLVPSPSASTPLRGDEINNTGSQNAVGNPALGEGELSGIGSELRNSEQRGEPRNGEQQSGELSGGELRGETRGELREHSTADAERGRTVEPRRPYIEFSDEDSAQYDAADTHVESGTQSDVVGEVPQQGTSNREVVEGSTQHQQLLQSAQQKFQRRQGESAVEYWARLQEASKAEANEHGLSVRLTRAQLKHVHDGSVTYLEFTCVGSLDEDVFVPVPEVLTVAAIDAQDKEPRSIAEAYRRKDAREWFGAVQTELNGLYTFKVFIEIRITDVPRGHRVLTSKVVFTRKRDEAGNVLKYKARIVVRGFMQEDDEVGDVFASVVRLECLRVLFSMAAAEGLTLYQMDITQAFLHAELGEVVYVRPPPGLYDTSEPVVWQLKKSLYGLRQSPNRFNQLIDRLLKANGLQPSSADPCIYVKTTKRGKIAIGLFVDDLVIAASNLGLVKDLQARLEQQLSLKFLGELKYCLGFQVSRDRESDDVIVTQETYAEQLLVQADMQKCKSVDTPFPPDINFTEADSEDKLDAQLASKYRSLVGGLLYLARGTRPDLAVGVNILSRYVSKAGKRHYAALRHMLRYIRGTTSQGLRYWGKRRQERLLSGENSYVSKLQMASLRNTLIGFSDADWASNDRQSRRSISGFVFLLNGAAVTWKTKRQASVALSTCEAEYMALVEAVKESIWLRRLLADLKLQQGQSTVIAEDNQAAIKLTEHDVFHERSKHIDIRYHFTREKIQEQVVKLVYCKTGDMVADAMTKPLSARILSPLRMIMMGDVENHSRQSSDE